jgi:hypothetical protein
MGMVIDYTITIGNLVEIASIIGGGLLVLVKLNNNVVSLKVDVSAMQAEITKLGEVLIKMAVTDTRVAAADSRIANLEQDVREMRHGDGFVKGPRGIDREYP